MTKKFIERLKEERTIDTKNYRYVIDGREIKRLPIDDLDTTAALNEWEVVGTL